MPACFFKKTNGKKYKGIDEHITSTENSEVINMKNKLLTALPACILALSGIGAVHAASTHIATLSGSSASQYESIETVNNNQIPADALKTALKGYQWAVKNGKVQNKNVLTVVDFSIPSKEKRLWLIDLNSHKVLMSMHVAQGSNPHFSNAAGSKASSLGVFTTGDVYSGEHGYSEHVNGLEQGINNNAASRALEVHRAWYVTPSFVQKYGRTGHSWGCFAVNPARATQYINYTKNGSVIFAYASIEQRDPNIATV